MKPATPLLALIQLYQRTLSPDTGWFHARHPYGFCRFYPTCSEYARESLERHGLFHGGALSAARILRCHPWSEPRHDPVPTIKHSNP